jgi:opacity protein-like surface antigen
MSRARILALAGATTLLSTATFAALSTATLAADLPPLPPPVYRPVAVEASGWYLRGFVGMSNQFLTDIHHPSFDAAPQFVFLDKGGFESGMFFGGGLGYAWNNWLRFDVTGEYRGKVGFNALDRYFNDPNFFTNDYRATKSEWVVLVNGYLDLGTWWCVTPFIGAGVGVAYNKIEHFRDTNVIAGGGGWADTGSKSNLAWALHAGASYKVTSNFAVDLSYRYLNLGKAESGLLVNLDPTVFSGNPLRPVTFNSIQSHDLMLGVRWLLQQDAPPPPPPLMRKG